MDRRNRVQAKLGARNRVLVAPLWAEGTLGRRNQAQEELLVEGTKYWMNPD